MATNLYEISNGKVRLYFHAGQSRAWRSQARFVFVIAGSQSGKTSFGPWWLYREISQKGPGDYLAVTASYDLFKLKMLPEMRNVFEHILGIGRYWAKDNMIEIADPATRRFKAKTASDNMWARIILRSASAEGGLESSTAKAAWLDECGADDFRVGAWEAVLRRLTLNQGRVLGTTTPYNLGWLKTQVYDKWQRGDPDFDVIQFKSTVNPRFTQEEFERQRRALPAWKFAMFFEGRFDRPAGLVYSDFIDKYREEGGHLVKPFELPTSWPRIVGIDPGAVNMAKVWLAHDIDTDVWYLYREQYGGHMSTPEHARAARELAQERGERVIGWYIGAKSESQQRLDWQMAGCVPVFEPPVSDVEAGIDRVIRLFRQHRLFIFDNCLGIRDELATYRREVDQHGNVLEGIKDKHKYHHLDALRYAAAGTDNGGVFFA